MSTNIRLPKLPSMPSASREKTQSACECGCLQQTPARFVPGHDARLAGWVKRVLRGVVTIPEIAAAHEDEAQGRSVAAATEKAARARKLAHIKWAEEAVLTDAMCGIEPAAEEKEEKAG